MNGNSRRDLRQIVRSAIGTAPASIRATRSAYSSSATVLNLHLGFADGSRSRAVFKLGERGVKPEMVYDPGRESWIYEAVLAGNRDADAPRLFATGCSPDRRHWLLLEWAGSVDLAQVGARAAWREAASRLASLHAWGESRVGELTRGSLVRWDDPRLHLWLARRADRGKGDPLAPLWRQYHVVAERIAAMSKTLVHGDLNATNVLVARGAGETRIRIIDWETAGIGPGLIDLAALTSGELPERHRREMLDAYRASYDAGVAAADFDESLTYCRLALAVQWLGWAPGWSPPPAHAHDWRAEAVAHASRLGLLNRA